jgi:hypothetical protein
VLLCPLPWTPPRFWEDPFTWVDHYVLGWDVDPTLHAPLFFVVTAFAGAAQIVLHRYMRHVAHRRATTQDGPDADFREPA